jgi:hypothetical protein
MAGVFGICRQCGAENVEYCRNGSRMLKCCQSCRNEDSKRRMRLTWARRKNHESLPVGKPCGCCHKPMQKPVLDHCHKTGCIRDWLCHSDNIVLGTFDDDPLAFLELAARATDRAARSVGQRRTQELDKGVRHLNRAAYLLKHRPQADSEAAAAA